MPRQAAITMETAMQKTIALVISLGITIATFGCGASQNPVSPDPVPIVNADVQASGAAVAVAGTIRGLDVRSRVFTLSMTSTTPGSSRSASRTILADEKTQVSIRGAQARFAALQNGMVVSVRGTDQRRFILAQSILSR